jgi:hypothetical protein
VKLCEEFWDEFLIMAKLLYMMDDRAEIYDVFEFIRQRQQGSGPYKGEFLKRIDMEIMQKEGPFEYHGIMG